MLPTSMKAVVLKGPYDIKVQDLPLPTIQADTDVLIKVSQAGLCGSDLHFYRGYSPGFDYIMGHEVVGEIVQAGSSVKKFKVGDMVLAPFCTSCGDCSYCKAGWTARCLHGQVPGNPEISGAQAEYFRMPLADSSLFSLPEDIPQELMLLMTDILPTGYSVASNARMLMEVPPVPSLMGGSSLKDGRIEKKGICVVIGCGPVGLCAITSAKTLFETVYATDLYAPRLKYAERHGAIALPFDDLKKELMEKTGGQGADACLEVVGHPSAVVSAMELARPCGIISSCGVHTKTAPINQEMLYDKNLRMQFGRCSVKTYYPLALEILRNNQELFSSFIEHKISWNQAEEYYRLFEQNKIAKTVFVA